MDGYSLITYCLHNQRFNRILPLIAGIKIFRVAISIAFYHISSSYSQNRLNAAPLPDTNVLLYFLAGDDTLTPIFEEKSLLISIISEMEILGYSELTAQEVKGIRKFFSQYPIININSDIKEKAIKLRRDFNLKLPDSIIAATADSLEIHCLLLIQILKSSPPIISYSTIVDSNFIVSSPSGLNWP